ncbi:Uncharacterised protein [Candidatus Tiddalikarchaeum anstoanum]|nr:Uncharacterised protein [Candidatus Tiddalikarchaeum anstoanum]
MFDFTIFKKSVSKAVNYFVKVTAIGARGEEVYEGKIDEFSDTPWDLCLKMQRFDTQTGKKYQTRIPFIGNNCCILQIVCRNELGTYMKPSYNNYELLRYFPGNYNINEVANLLGLTFGELVKKSYIGYINSGQLIKQFKEYLDRINSSFNPEKSIAENYLVEENLAQDIQKINDRFNDSPFLAQIEYYINLISTVESASNTAKSLMIPDDKNPFINFLKDLFLVYNAIIILSSDKVKPLIIDDFLKFRKTVDSNIGKKILIVLLENETFTFKEVLIQNVVGYMPWDFYMTDGRNIFSFVNTISAIRRIECADVIIYNNTLIQPSIDLRDETSLVKVLDFVFGKGTGQTYLLYNSIMSYLSRIYQILNIDNLNKNFKDVRALSKKLKQANLVTEQNIYICEKELENMNCINKYISDKYNINIYYDTLLKELSFLRTAFNQGLEKDNIIEIIKRTLIEILK